MRFLAIAIGIAVTLMGLVAVFVPYAFVGFVGTFQKAPMLYLIVAVRIAIGVVLILAAPESRTPTTFRVLGALLIVAGLLTPFIGAWSGHTIRELWSWSGPVVARLWGLAAIGMGLFTVYGMSGKPRAGE